MGNALKFYASVRLEVRRTGSSKQGTEITGNDVRIKVVKNKIAPPFREANVNIAFGEGISREAELLILGADDRFKNPDGTDIVEKSGAWYSYEGDKLGQGAEKSKEFLKANPRIADEIEAKIRDAHARYIGKDLAEFVPAPDEDEAPAE